MGIKMIEQYTVHLVVPKYCQNYILVIINQGLLKELLGAAEAVAVRNFFVQLAPMNMSHCLFRLRLPYILRQLYILRKPV